MSGERTRTEGRMQEELTLGETMRLASKNETKLDSLEDQLNAEKADRAQERHSFRSEMTAHFNVIQTTQLDLLDRSSRMEERLTTLTGMQQTLLAQATMIGELRESLRGVEQNRTTIQDLIAKVAVVMTRLDIMQQMGGKSIGIVATVMCTAIGSFLVGVMVYLVTRTGK